jgi:hypothetical protein
MKTRVAEKLQKIVSDIDTQGNASLTRLTVLKKWFEQPERHAAFALFVGMEAVTHEGSARAPTKKLLAEAQALLRGLDPFRPKPNREAAEDLHNRLRDFQNEYRNQQWARIRIINNWDLLLVEEALAILLWYSHLPTYGYKLAADYAQYFDSRYGNGLNGPSRAKIVQMIRFVEAVGAFEEKSQ